ncbi:MAG: hypothetical protein IJI14_03800 [Anaerolineaceae bacterium]|nr:hypothetical protein [Anaerolineaceae bacterium]
MENNYLLQLSQMGLFTRSDLLSIMNNSGQSFSPSTANKLLQTMLKNGTVVRVGRNIYQTADPGRRKYIHQYSELSENTADMISSMHPFLNFSVFELIQLNKFVNHQIAHNTVFVSVENGYGEDVFETLKQEYPGKILIHPNPEIYHQYWTDNMLIINRLTSEAPSGGKIKWHTCLEKMLVDLLADSIFRDVVSSSELPNIFANAFEKYIVDENKLLRYARRRGAEDKVCAYIRQHTDFNLRSE